MKRLGLFLVIWGCFLSFDTQVQGKALTEHPARDVYKGWHLGVQAYTFNRFTFFEAVDKAAELGLSWIEVYPGQQFSPDMPDAKFDHNMSAEMREAAKKKLAAAGIKAYGYGVVGLPNNEAECRKVFDFCKEMGIGTIASEPEKEAFNLIEKLCKEYKIAMAIHNHPAPSRYWNPDKVLEVCKGRSKWIGACADTGHWMRSGIVPLEAVKKLKDRIIYFHLKDLNQFGVCHKGEHDVPWGQGKAGLDEILKYLHSVGWQGSFSAEYEHNWLESVPELRQCVHYFEKLAGSMNPSGWHYLLADDLSNCSFSPDSWEYKDDLLTRKGGGYIWTEDKYGDFILDLEFKVDKNANSGVFIRTGDLKNYVQDSIEIQIHDTGDGTKHGQCGAIYDCLSPRIDLGSMAGRWNHLTIEAKGPMIYVVMDGVQIIKMNVDDWKEAGKNPDYVGTSNKFKKAIKDMPRAGYIGFQDHGDPVWYRNIKIKACSK